MYDCSTSIGDGSMEKARYFEFEWFEEIRKLSILQILGASLLIGLLAQIRIPLYFTPVPITGQTLAVMLIGALLGSRKGSLAVICYLIQGAFGMPVFAGGSFGLIHFTGPSGGYLFGFVLQAYLIGLLFEQKNILSRMPVFLKIFLPGIIQLVIGTVWLANFTGWNSAWTCGFYPFILGELIKVGLTTSYLRFYEKHFSLSR
jgi:biotin transport system substrate-specific component